MAVRVSSSAGYLKKRQIFNAVIKLLILELKFKPHRLVGRVVDRKLPIIRKLRHKADFSKRSIALQDKK
jgi:hypothetical protein